MTKVRRFDTMDDAARLDLAPWGYAPGTNFFYCNDCQTGYHPDGNWPHQGHKHSTRCIQHAMAAYLSDLRASEGHLAPDEPDYAPFGHNPIEIAINRHQARLRRSLTVGAIFIAMALLVSAFY